MQTSFDFCGGAVAKNSEQKCKKIDQLQMSHNSIQLADSRKKRIKPMMLYESHEILDIGQPSKSRQLRTVCGPKETKDLLSIQAFYSTNKDVARPLTTATPRKRIVNNSDNIRTTLNQQEASSKVDLRKTARDPKDIVQGRFNPENFAHSVINHSPCHPKKNVAINAGKPFYLK